MDGSRDRFSLPEYCRNISLYHNIRRQGLYSGCHLLLPLGVDSLIKLAKQMVFAWFDAGTPVEPGCSSIPRAHGIHMYDKLWRVGDKLVWCNSGNRAYFAVNIALHFAAVRGIEGL